MRNARVKIVAKGSEEEGNANKLIKLRFEKRNKFFGVFHDFIRWVMLYRSLKYPR